MTPRVLLSTILCLGLAACVPPQSLSGNGAQQPGAFASDFRLDDLASYLRRVSRHGPAARQAEVERLKAEPNLAAEDRLKLAYLLSLDGASADDLTQSAKLADGLERAFSDPDTRLYVRLLQRTITAEASLKRESARADDAEAKLGQLKKLELDLMQRNRVSPPAKDVGR